MSNILSVSVRKEVAEEIISGTNRELKLQRTAYWSKRLLENPKEKPANFKFKDYDMICILSGRIKCLYPILGFRGNTSAFYISIDVDNPVVKDNTGDSDPHVIEDVEEVEVETPQEDSVETETPETETPQEDETETPPVEEDNETETPQEEKLEEDIKEKIDNMLDEFCHKNNVINVNTPVVQVGHDGTVFGYNKTIHTFNKAEVVLNIKPKRFMHYYDVSDDDFVSNVKKELERISVGNAVFIWKKRCNYVVNSNGHRILTLYFATERLAIKFS